MYKYYYTCKTDKRKINNYSYFADMNTFFELINKWNSMFDQYSYYVTPEQNISNINSTKMYYNKKRNNTFYKELPLHTNIHDLIFVYVN